MIRSEITRILGRRVMTWTCLLLGAVPVVGLVAYQVARGRQSGGTDLLADFGALSTMAVILSILLAALAGSYDTANGTMRYLVLTGVPRGRLFANRIVATLTVITLTSLPAVLIGLGAALTLRQSSAANPDVGDLAGGAWAYLGGPLVFGLVSVAIGSLLGSNGAAIGVALGLYLGGTLLTQLVATHVDERVAAYLLPAATDAVTSWHAGAIPLAGSVLVLVAWLAALCIAAHTRLSLDEY